MGEDKKIDLLDRQTFVENIVKIIDTVKDNKSSCTFSVNGKWGSGKTFVMDMLARRLKEKYKDGGRVMVIKYNCWQYDYYEEPLMAIVSAIQDSVADDGTDEFYRITKNAVKEIVSAFAKVDINGILENGKNSDKLFELSKAISHIREKLKELAEKYTLVIIVDEIDRCLPVYSIKVLERLHHLFDDLSNTAVVISMDKRQLEHAVKDIFGDETNTDGYLKKFIDFELNLEKGEINEKFSEKYSGYAGLFENKFAETGFDVNEFFAELFAGCGMRQQEKLMNRITTIHKMLFKDTKKDISFMCFELIMGILEDSKFGWDNVLIDYDADREDICLNGLSEKFNKYIAEKWDVSGEFPTYVGPDKEFKLAVNGVNNAVSTELFIMYYAAKIYSNTDYYVDIEGKLLAEKEKAEELQEKEQPRYEDIAMEAKSYIADLLSVKELLKLIK